MIYFGLDKRYKTCWCVSNTNEFHKLTIPAIKVQRCVYVQRGRIMCPTVQLKVKLINRVTLNFDAVRLFHRYGIWLHYRVNSNRIGVTLSL
jgi:hypothetical protein